MSVLMKQELRFFQAVAEKDWPLPRGYRVRIAAAYLAWVYSHAESAEKYFWIWAQKHGVEHCYGLRVFLHIAGLRERLLARARVSYCYTRRPRPVEISLLQQDRHPSC